MNGPKRRPGPGNPGRLGPKGGRGLKLREVAPGEFEVVHPPCVGEVELDYAEAMEVWQAGEPEEAREMLLYALEACRDNLWIHAALGRIALEEMRNPDLARGHFGYAFELSGPAAEPGFRGTLPTANPANRPLHEAAEGLARCAEALGRTAEVAELRRLLRRWEGNP